MMSAPPVTPPEARLASASEATLVPTVDLKVAADIADAAFEQRLGDGEDTLAGECIARAEAQLLDFFHKGPFGHLQVLLLNSCRPRSNVVPADVLQNLVERRDQRRIFGIVYAVEHRLEFVVHERPGAAEFGASLVG